jgi:hypothetical protein
VAGHVDSRADPSIGGLRQIQKPIVMPAKATSKQITDVQSSGIAAMRRRPTSQLRLEFSNKNPIGSADYIIYNFIKLLV